MKKRLQDVKTKIESIQRIGTVSSVFGSSRHKFILNSTKSENEIQQFELDNKTQLPPDYRNFLKTIGNGGAGPFYGLEKLEDGVFADIDYKDREAIVDLSKPFKFIEKWNLDQSDFKDENGEINHELMDEEYFDPKWADGMLRISNFGCGVSINLIVNGDEFGNIWLDDRCNENGIAPFQTNEKNRVTFLDWYESWLDESIEKTKSQLTEPVTRPKTNGNKKGFWNWLKK